MQKDLYSALLKHNQQVPRYTSYPTAPHFKSDLGHKEVSDWLKNSHEEEIFSLYFHIPFCKNMCWYCGCNTKATKQYEPVTEYLEYLKKEITLIASTLKTKHTVRHIHFGGGSPSYIRADDFRALMEHVRRHFNILPDAEIAIELDPREISEAKIAAYAQQGVTRASLGVQDFHSNVQKSINRIQPFRSVFKSVELLNAYGIESINFDLLYGLPHQTAEILKENVSLAANMKPSRISLFGYAHVPWMKKHMKLIDEDVLPDSFARLEQFDVARQALLEKGYIEIGLDHFAVPEDPMAKAFQANKLHRNFQGYTTDSAPTLIGLGSSAISAHLNGYCQNMPDTRSYYAALSEGKLPIAKGITLNSEDYMRRHIINQIMCYRKIDLKAVAKTYGVEPESFSYEVNSLQKFENDNLLKIDGWKITINANAAQATRLAAAAFDTYLAPAPQSHAQIA